MMCAYCPLPAAHAGSTVATAPLLVYHRCHAWCVPALQKCDTDENKNTQRKHSNEVFVSANAHDFRLSSAPRTLSSTSHHSDSYRNAWINRWKKEGKTESSDADDGRGNVIRRVFRFFFSSLFHGYEHHVIALFSSFSPSATFRYDIIVTHA